MMTRVLRLVPLIVLALLLARPVDAPERGLPTPGADRGGQLAALVVATVAGDPARPGDRPLPLPPGLPTPRTGPAPLQARRLPRGAR
ncbi:MAG: hypothetical protein KDK22_03005 [Rhodobacteraceae bacterium]|nr:hypothetical protein [Paracoccaceae bacterium]